MTQCPACCRELPFSDAAFCPYCGKALPKAQPEVPQEVKQLLSDLGRQKDPVQKHKLLTQAQQRFPDSLEIAEEILFLGRLHERSPKKLDYAVIKCYLWQMYLTPKDFSLEQQNAMREELLRHPHLMRCLRLAPDADAFMRRYLRRLAGEFVHVFLMGSTHYTRSVFGFRIDNRMGRVLAEPAADMLCAIRRDEALVPDERVMLYDAFYHAFVTETGGESQWLDTLLEKKGDPVPDRG